MAEENKKDERYWGKVKTINDAVGCSHHPQNALDLVQKNDWSETGITQKYFSKDNSFGLISDETLAKLSPRQRIAYERLSNAFMLFPSMAYYLARGLRQGFKNAPAGKLDKILLDSTSYNCATECAELAYSIEYPFSSALDVTAGMVAGAVVSPIAFIAGLAYTPGKNKN